MNLKLNQIISTQAGYARVISVRSFNQTLKSLSSPVPRKKSKASKPKQIESSRPNSPSENIKKDPLDFNFGEVFLLLERLAGIDDTKFKVEENGLIQVEFLNGGKGFISPKYVLISKIGQKQDLFAN